MFATLNLDQAVNIWLAMSAIGLCLLPVGIVFLVKRRKKMDSAIRRRYLIVGLFCTLFIPAAIIVPPIAFVTDLLISFTFTYANIDKAIIAGTITATCGLILLPVGMVLLAKRKKKADPKTRRLYLILGIIILLIIPGTLLAPLYALEIDEQQSRIEQWRFDHQENKEGFITYERLSDPDDAAHAVYSLNFKKRAFVSFPLDSNYGVRSGDMDRTSLFTLTDKNDEKIFCELPVYDRFTNPEDILKNGEPVLVVYNITAGKIGLYTRDKFQAVFDLKNKVCASRIGEPAENNQNSQEYLWPASDQTWPEGFDQNLTDFNQWVIK